ncbi:hypothetical protein HYG77_18755 [Rhodococcus sp. ZPP]|uniref:hypothetical protein n=1 Tax=Rhodococcus sp. ZPP TaxID=2749906 RepID=UPI001AD89E9D|nr:hypothetical protein [Rhodococcus sp. ZPP]QTJ67421.1 hypothetical protein HYG77_18755 [Rhodococcus sp. ZPP]
MSVLTQQQRVAVGDRAVSAERRVSDVIAASGATFPGSGASLTGVVIAGVLDASNLDGAARTGLQWNTVSAVEADDVVRAESVITRVQRSEDTVEVDRHLRLIDENGSVREQGVETWRLPEGSAVGTDPATDFCTVAWAELLREALADDRNFTSSLATWDGTIGLCCLDGSGHSREVHLRIYRGRIIDISRRVPGGATFTLRAPASTWVDLIFGEHHDFMRRAIRGEFSSAGDGYEYLRLTKPLDILVTHARAAANDRRREQNDTPPLTGGREARS